MKTKNIFYFMAFGLVILALFAVSCNKEDEELKLIRNFRPVGSSVDIQGNTITAKWYPTKGAEKYIVQLSRDTFKVIDLEKEVSKDSTVVIFSGLKWNQAYNIRVKAVNIDTSMNSKWGVLLSFTSSIAIYTDKFPTILSSVNDSDVIDKSVRFRWALVGISPTRLVVRLKSDSSVVNEIELDADAAKKTLYELSGLTPGTEYLVDILSKDELRGYQSFTTKKAVAEGSIVDISNEIYSDALLKNTIASAPINSSIILKKGQIYTLSENISLDRSITLVSALGFGSAKPTIEIASSSATGFNITANKTIDSIAFRNINIVATADGLHYVFNINTLCSVGSVTLDGCKIERVRGVLRLQLFANSVSKFTMNNCIADSIGGFGIIAVNNAGSVISNLIIQNSTIYKSQRIINIGTNSNLNFNSVLINNCTFNDVVTGVAAGSSVYMFDFGTITSVNSLIIKNTILGKVRDASTVKGHRGVSFTTFKVEDTYSTADHVTDANAPLPDIIKYTGKSNALFKDPSNIEIAKADFSIIDTKFAGKGVAGDPRWNK